MWNDIRSDFDDSQSYNYSDNNSDQYHLLNESYAYIHRFLASSPLSTYKIDYNVLSVAAMTLALIMMVEYIRHRLDHWAYQAATTETPQQSKQPLYRAVLEGVYAELATLGMVEFVLHLIEEYYPSYDKARKSVFADVHFLLFYTAIINALFSIVTAMIVTRISKQLWIQTELLEMYHYNEIQQTFIQIQKELNALHSATSKIISDQEDLPQPSSTSDPEVGAKNDASTNDGNDVSATIWDDPWTYGQINVRNAYTSLIDHIRYPNLKYQYDTLLSQIRFHDLRSHIIDSYQLPKQLKISNYLMRCSEQTVLMKLVNVSSLAWLLLTAAVCIFYFVLGVVFYKFEDQSLIGTSLSIIYIVWMLSFVLLCFVLSNKTKSIFYTLLHDTELWDVATNSVQEKEHLAQKQLALFWYSEPTLIIKLIQFMQFGYAASLSTIIVFWVDIDKGMIPMYAYVVTLVFCYLLFIHVSGHAIPRYTLCTSLGQLVNDRYLRETVALYRLNEAKQKEKERYYDDMNDHTPQSYGMDGKNSVLNNSIVVVNQDSYLNNLNSEKESVSDRTSKSVCEIIIEEQLENENQTSKLNNEQVKRWLSGSDAAVASKAANETLRTSEPLPPYPTGTNEYSMPPTNGENFALVDRLDAISSNDSDDGHEKQLDQVHHNLEADEKDRQFASLVDSSNHVSITFENLVLNNGSNTNNRKQLDQSNDEDDDIDDLYVSYADNVQPSTESPQSANVKQSSFRESRRTLMMNQRQNHSSKYENESVMHRVCRSLHSYYTSERHVEISNVYGAIVAFYLVGQRVEGFIHSQGLVSSAFLSFHFRLDVTFWLLFAWLSMFIGASVLIAVLLWSFDDFQTMKGYKLGAAALIDFVLSSVCLAVLVIAEVDRCCESGIDAASIEQQLGRSSFNDPGPIPCSCPQFGTRLYGGLGTIEPYVSIVFLRILRHWVARKIIKATRRKYNWPNVKLSDDEEQHDKHQLAKSTHKITKFGGNSMHDLNNMSIVTEMWEATIGANPDIAAKYGEFSTEILRAMLGLPSPVHEHPTTSNNITGDKSIDTDVLASKSPSASTKLFALQQQYSALSPEAQEIILAGKIGRRMVRSTSCALEKTPTQISRNSLTRNQSVMFEIDNFDTTDGDETYCNFISPNARLLHSMRRCDRKFLPLLDKWTTVDVLITRFEVVYLEVATDDTNNENSTSADCIREALHATKGGKGLRLCDVVAGRRVTGRVGFSDIRCLHVERHLPYDDDLDADAAMSSDCPTVEVESMEFWKHSKSRPSIVNSNNKTTRTQQWCHVKEDHLRIETASGTLILRFFADLEDAKYHPEHLSIEFEATGKLFQNNALQWAKSIASLCGPEQLTKQHLSHFGENSSEELRDYLVIVDRKKKRHSHLRVLSDGVDNIISTGLSFRGISRPNLIQRVMSVRAMSGNSTGAEERNIRRHFDGFETSSNMNGEPSSNLLPSKDRKVSFSQPET